MNENPSAKLFKEPANWPLIPPWWLVSSTEAAALLNIKPATLHSWRARGQGPKPYPPMYLRPTQGRPLYYQYGALRAWAASKLGMAYRFDDQCMDFFWETCPMLAEGSGSIQSRIDVFERQLTQDRERVLRGETPTLIQVEHVHDLDVYHSRQPKRTRKTTGPLEVPCTGTEQLDAGVTPRVLAESGSSLHPTGHEFRAVKADYEVGDAPTD